MAHVISKGGWKRGAAFDRLRVAQPARKPRTPEEIARDDERFQDFVTKMGWNTGTEKIADREARVAVEGDTDMNHDNVEAAE